MSKGRPKIGDIVQIRTCRGFSYAQLSHWHKLCGYLLRVLPGHFPDPVTYLAELVQEHELYYTFVFKDDLFQPPTVSIIGHEKVPDRCKLFPLFRDGVRNPETHRVETWWLWDGNQSWPVGTLTDDQKRLSIRSIWNYLILSERVGKGWMPSDEY